MENRTKLRKIQRESVPIIMVGTGLLICVVALFSAADGSVTSDLEILVVSIWVMGGAIIGFCGMMWSDLKAVKDRLNELSPTEPDA